MPKAPNVRIHLVIQTPLLRPENEAEIYTKRSEGPNDEHETGKAGYEHPYELCQD